MELPPKYVTRTVYARMRGMSFTAVEKAIYEGRMTLLPGGLIDPEVADREWAENTGLKRGVRPPNGSLEGGNGVASGTQTLTVLRAQHEQLKLDLAREELSRVRGETLDAKGVRDAQFERARRVRDAVLQVPQQCAAAWAACVDPQECKRIAERALREALGGEPK
jgi:hypothetical protein